MGSAPSASFFATSPEHNVVELTEGLGEGRPRGHASGARRPGGGVRSAALGGLRPGRQRRLGGAVRSQESGTQGAPGLQREEARLPQLSPVLQGGGDQRSGRPEDGAPTLTTTCSPSSRSADDAAPLAAATALACRLTAVRSRTSTHATWAVSRSVRMRWATGSRVASVRPARCTLAPSRAYARATAHPIARLAP